MDRTVLHGRYTFKEVRFRLVAGSDLFGEVGEVAVFDSLVDGGAELLVRLGRTLHTGEQVIQQAQEQRRVLVREPCEIHVPNRNTVAVTSTIFHHAFLVPECVAWCPLQMHPNEINVTNSHGLPATSTFGKKLSKPQHIEPAKTLILELGGILDTLNH